MTQIKKSNIVLYIVIALTIIIGCIIVFIAGKILTKALNNIDSMKSELNSLRSDVDSLKTDKAKLIENNVALKIKNTELKEENANLKATNNGYKIEFQNTTTELDTAYTTIDELNKTIENLNNELDKKPTMINFDYNYTKDELDILYKCVQSEAGGKNYDAAKLITQVILNRVKSSGFPNTITEVIYQPGQFEVVTNGAINRQVLDQKMIDAVNEVLLTGSPLPASVLFFYSDSQVREDHWIRTLKVHDIVQDTVFAYGN